MKIRLGVIFGGVSVEHEVSVISALQAMQNIDTNRYDVIAIYITKDGEWYTGDMLKDGSIVIDVGINNTDNGICGDVDFNSVTSFCNSSI